MLSHVLLVVLVVPVIAGHHCDLHSGRGVCARWSGTAIIICTHGVLCARASERRCHCDLHSNVWTVRELGISYALEMVLRL